MSYRILTYSDPYKLDQYKYWDEIKDLTHFCVSQTLVNGLKKNYRHKFSALLCTIDKMLEKYYGSWHNNAETYIKQYVELSKLLQRKLYNRDPKFKNAVKLNQGQLLEAIRLLQELGIPSTRLDRRFANPEQEVLLDILQEIEKSDLEIFCIQEANDPDHLRNAMLDVVKTQINEVQQIKTKNDFQYELKEEEIQYLQVIFKKIANCPLESVVFHGIHQFSPLILKFISSLVNMGIEVIFLFNYQQEYPAIYDTWLNIYSCFDVNPEKDVISSSYILNPLSDSQRLAKCFGDLMEGRPVAEKLDSIDYLEFNNLTEFANYVAEEFEKGKNENPNPLAGMKEHFYSSSGEVNDILKMYYPEQFGERHFLAYPIGQFFASMYNMWDNEKKHLRFSNQGIKEILNAGILESKTGANLLSVYYRIEIFVSGVNTVEELISRLDLLKKNIKCIETDPYNYSDLKLFEFYNVAWDEVDALQNALRDLLEIAEKLFALDEKGYINFRTHYIRLLEFLKSRANSNAIKTEELKLVNSLLNRLNNIDKLSISGTMGDLQQSIAYYLKQSSSENNSANWIVKNFEQIDGDILISKIQEPDHIYHFCCLSDHQMQKSTDDKLPWPLTRAFLEQAYNPIELNFQVYMTSLNEYHYFMRYALFYGLCYNQRNLKLSYIRIVDDEPVQPYFLLDILDIKKRKWIAELRDGGDVPVISFRPYPNRRVNIPTIKEAQSFQMCPYKYFLEHIAAEKRGGYYDDDFLCRQYYFVLLLEKVWHRFERKPFEPVKAQLDAVLEACIAQDAKFFPFWRVHVDIYDIKTKVKKYFMDYCLTDNKRMVKEVDEDFLKIKKDFLYNKYPDAEDPSRNKVAFLKKIVKSQTLRSQLRANIQDFINRGNPHVVQVDLWCENCKSKNICLEGYGRKIE